MQFRELFADDDAVSPVIGVILMVAITVILAAVIGTFVLGLGDQVQSNPPNAQFTTDYDQSAQNLTFTHDSGEAIDHGRLNFSSDEGFNSSAPDDFSDNSALGSGQMAAGDSVTISDEGGEDYQWASGANPDEDTVRLVWTSEGGDNSDTLRSWNGPEA